MFFSEEVSVLWKFAYPGGIESEAGKGPYVYPIAYTISLLIYILLLTFSIYGDLVLNLFINPSENKHACNIVALDAKRFLSIPPRYPSLPDLI